MIRIGTIGEELAIECMDESGRTSIVFYLSCKPHHGVLKADDHGHDDILHRVDGLHSASGRRQFRDVGIQHRAIHYLLNLRLKSHG
jgi:hypothetical protein